MLLRNIVEKISIKPLFFLLLPFFATSVSADPLPDVALKVLVISPTAETNEINSDGSVNTNYARGLDAIDDMLDEMGVPYDVLDASKEVLDWNKLVTNGQGNYNGIILTNSFLYYPSEGNPWSSAFTLDEWKLLHEYERTYNVRESVMSGDPIPWCWAKQDLDLDYGMDWQDVESNYSDLTASWNIPAGSVNDKEVFEYVNRNQSVALIGEKFLATPRSIPLTCSAEVVLDATATPLLIDKASGKALISRVEYPDGREVLLSTITNAWYLVFSQVLNYEFLNFATQGVFIGSRKVYLSAHIDDVFIGDDLWNIGTNTTGPNSYRTTPADIQNVVSANAKFINGNSALMSDYKLDFVYNGIGAARPPLESQQDTFIDSMYRRADYGDQNTAYSSNLFRLYKQHALFDFGSVQLPAGIDSYEEAATAILTLTTANNVNSPSGHICMVNKAWDESANWRDKLGTGSCVSYTYKASNGSDTQGIIEANVTSLVNQWKESGGSNNFGFLVRARKNTWVELYTREADNESYRPKLYIEYVSDSQPLTDAIVANADHFRFINHTLTHRKLFESTGATYDIVFAELDENLKVWEELNLPGFYDSYKVLVTGEHSGLENGIGEYTGGDYALEDLIPYPAGLNRALVDAMEALGIEYIASDSSRVNQNTEQKLPNSNIMLLPRYPTSVFYNVTTPAELTDEYNYIFYERYGEMDPPVDPCTVPAAICAPRSYSQILAAEAETAFRHMLSYKPWPHYFHSANLRNYSGGNTLVYDWLNVVVNKYKSYMRLPIINIDYLSNGEKSREKLLASEANVKGVWNRDNNTVTVTADSPVTVRMTGVGSDSYGGQYQLKATVDANGEVFTVNRSLD